MNTIGMIGAGQLGSVLAKRLVENGYRVKVANSRGQGSLQSFAEQTGAIAADISDVSLDVDILIMAIPLNKIRVLPKAVFARLPEHSVVVDACNYVPIRDGEIEQIETGLPESVWVSQQLGISVVKAFNSISDVSLSERGRPRGANDRVALPVSGNKDGQRAVVMRLIENLGFDAFDAGPLGDSWRQQLGQPGYCTDPTLKQLPRLLSRANQNTLASNRDKAMKLMARLPKDFAKQDLVRVARLMIGLDVAKVASWVALVRLATTLLRRATST